MLYISDVQKTMHLFPIKHLLHASMILTHAWYRFSSIFVWLNLYVGLNCQLYSIAARYCIWKPFAVTMMMRMMRISTHWYRQFTSQTVYQSIGLPDAVVFLFFCYLDLLSLSGLCKSSFPRLVMSALLASEPEMIMESHAYSWQDHISTQHSTCHSRSCVRSLLVTVFRHLPEHWLEAG